jgi:hypothetical protein
MQAVADRPDGVAAHAPIGESGTAVEHRESQFAANDRRRDADRYLRTATLTSSLVRGAAVATIALS